MPVLITGVEVEIEAGEGETNVFKDEKELVLDAGFVVTYTNSFGQTFRLIFFASFLFYFLSLQNLICKYLM